MLCLNSCYSGQYYYNIFNHGTLFYTTDLMYFGQGGSAAYVNAIMAGQDEDGIWQALQATKVASETTLYDWKKF